MNIPNNLEGSELRKGEAFGRYNEEAVNSLGGVALPPSPRCTHISLIATAAAQTLSQEDVSTGETLSAGILLARSNLHCLSAEEIKSQGTDPR